jgi:hypothetical protein
MLAVFQHFFWRLLDTQRRKWSGEEIVASSNIHRIFSLSWFRPPANVDFLANTHYKTTSDHTSNFDWYSNSISSRLPTVQAASFHPEGWHVIRNALPAPVPSKAVSFATWTWRNWTSECVGFH